MYGAGRDFCNFVKLGALAAEFSLSYSSSKCAL